MVSAYSVPKAERGIQGVMQQANQMRIQVQGNTISPQNSPKKTNKMDPQYSFGKESRKDVLSLVPGPGSYEVKDHTTINQPSFTMLSRRDLLSEKNPVGPGQYDPSHRLSKEGSPAYSLQGRMSDKTEAKPGPGQYETPSDINKSRAYNFGKDSRSKIELSAVPGPGSYEYQNAAFKYGSKMEPSYGFGSRIALKEDRSVPGPGQYQPKVENYSRIGGIVSRDLRNSLVDNKTPGPGNYQVDVNKINHKDPSFSLSKSSRDYRGDDNLLGPGHYDHSSYLKNKSSVISSQFGKASREQMERQNAPGPGAYETPAMKSKHGIRIGEKARQGEESYVPGPGAYDALKSASWLNGKGRYSLGKESRQANFKTDSPGPGAYAGKFYDISNSRGKMSFTKEDRLKHTHDANPGPGHYQLKPFFADVPKYLLSVK